MVKNTVKYKENQLQISAKKIPGVLRVNVKFEIRKIKSKREKQPHIILLHRRFLSASVSRRTIKMELLCHTIY